MNSRPAGQGAGANRRWNLVLILLAAAGLRLYGLTTVSPPGLAHDEVANWLIDRSLLAGRHAVYYAEAYGHEAGFHYLQAAFVTLLGDHALALRLPAAFAGLLGLAVSHALARQLFGRRVALFASALLGVLFWPVFFSRLGLRAILLPLISGLSAYFWWRAWRHDAGEGRSPGSARLQPPALRFYLLSALLAGLSLYTYMAARVVPIFYALFIFYLALRHRSRVRRHWHGILLFWLVFLVVAAPLAGFLLANPGAEYRIGEIDAPLQALRQGDLRPVVDNFVDILWMFGGSGDPLWRQNVAGWSVFDPITALIFYLCLALCLWFFRDSRYAFLFLWVLTAIIPSVLTKDAPSSIRIINIMPVLTILPAIVMHRTGELSTENGLLSTAISKRWAVTIVTILIVLFHLGRTAWGLFITWPQNEEVTFVWQESLADAAAYLDAAPNVDSVAVGGWTPETMDPPTMALLLRREDLTLRYFHPERALLVPAVANGTTGNILHPAILPLAPLLQEQLDQANVIIRTRETFTVYMLNGPLSLSPQFPADLTFGEELDFLGHTLSAACQLEAEPCQVLTFWRVRLPAQEPRRFFLHAVDGAGALLATADGLGAPAEYWQVGDQIVQRHLLPEIPAPFELRLGVYDPESGRRLRAASGIDYISLNRSS